MNYWEAIRAWRIFRGLSQSALGKRLDYPSPQSRINNYETEAGAKNAREPSLVELQRIADALACDSVSALLAGPNAHPTFLQKHEGSLGVSLSPAAESLIEAITTADRTRTVSQQDWQHLQGLVNSLASTQRASVVAPRALLPSRD